MARRGTRIDIRKAAKGILVVLGALAAINLAFYLIFVGPSIGEHRRLTESREPFQGLSDRRVLVEGNESFLVGVRQAKTDLVTLKDDILSTRDLRLVDVQSELAEICARFGIDLESVGTDNELLLSEELDRFSMNVPLEDNYANLRKFLQAVEESQKFLIVERVSLARGKEGGQLLSLNVLLATYFTAPEEMVERSRNRRGGRR